MSMRQIKKVRKPVPRFFMVDRLLGACECDQVWEEQIKMRDGHEIRIRLYRPEGGEPLPIILNYHGGGYVVGNLQLTDYYCRQLAMRVGAVVISVDYRLAPEFKFPTAVHDAYDSLCWAAANASSFGGDASRIGVTGDSAGGNLSAGISLMARDLQGPKINFQALIYPATNSRLDYPSLEEHKNAPILCTEDVHFFHDLYCPKPEDQTNPYFSPYLAEDLSNLPDALIITAGLDPLHDDGMQYHARLLAEGNSAEWVDCPNDLHGFVTFPNHTESGQKMIDLIIDRFSQRFLPER